MSHTAGLHVHVLLWCACLRETEESKWGDSTEAIRLTLSLSPALESLPFIIILLLISWPFIFLCLSIFHHFSHPHAVTEGDLFFSTFSILAEWDISHLEDKRYTYSTFWGILAPLWLIGNEALDPQLKLWRLSMNFAIWAFIKFDLQVSFDLSLFLDSWIHFFYLSTFIIYLFVETLV